MMFKMRMPALLSVVFLFCFGVSAMAEPVEVFTPKDEKTSPMQLRTKALSEAFALAILGEAQLMLSPQLNEERAELFRQYLAGHGKPYIQGYKILSSQDVEDGLHMSVDVRVNRKTLRNGLKALGFFDTLETRQPASVTWPEDISEEDMSLLRGLMVMSGLEPAGEVQPSFSLERTAEGTYKGLLSMDGNEWRSANKDMSVVWVQLWTHFFTRTKTVDTTVPTQLLTVSGWFSPDGVLEFDRVLKEWDSAIQEAKLLEMDMQATGVGATWNLNISNGDRLNILLNSYLPQRGLSFHLHQELTE